MRRAAGPVTEHDLAAVRGFEAALQAASMHVGSFMASLSAHGELGRQFAALSKAARVVVAFDAAPRHRVLPEPADTVDWLDRHIGSDTDPLEPDEFDELLFRLSPRPADLLPAAHG